MRKRRFDRRELLCGLLSNERVRVRPYGEGDRTMPVERPPEMELLVGAFCPVSIGFASVHGLPEIAHVIIGDTSFDCLASEIGEGELAAEIYGRAAGMRWISILSDGQSATSREQLCKGHVASSRTAWGPDGAAGAVAAGQDGDGRDLALFHGTVRRDSHRASASGSGNGRHTVWYEDVSWDGPEELVDKAVREHLLALLMGWEDLFPDFEVDGCGDDEVSFRFQGCPGGIYAEFDERLGGLTCEISMECAGSAYAGDICMDAGPVALESPSDAWLGEFAGKAPGFMHSARSFMEHPLVIGRQLVSSSYREGAVPSSLISLHPASTPEEAYDALRGTVPEPSNLARAVLAGGLDGYGQRRYDAQHDVERLFYDFSYDGDSAELEFSEDENETVNIDRLPSFRETSRVRIRNLTLPRLERLAKMGERVVEPDPDAIEWSLNAPPTLRVAGSVVNLLGYETRGLFAFSASGTV